MIDPLEYRGRRVVVAGGGGAGMGAATSRILHDLGAEVHVLDLQQPTGEVAGYVQVDLRDPAAIDTAVDEVGGRVDALFNCQGLASRVNDPLDVVTVNVITVRYLCERIAPRMPPGSAIVSITSKAGMSWSDRLALHQDFLSMTTVGDAQDWARAHAGDVADGYAFSKEALIVYTMQTAASLIMSGIRINAVGPGTVRTPMTDAVEVASPAAAKIMAHIASVIGREARPEEVAWPLVMLNSPRCSYVTGQAVYIDGGCVSAVLSGQLEELPPL
jgi:NAD(P)-dependent dehydrogenase (short-subunit alcohol dehydrogenase family)